MEKNIPKDCLLCLTKNLSDPIDIYGETGKRLNVEQIINRHFGIQLIDNAKGDNNDGDGDNDDNRNVHKLICNKCWTVTNSFHQLYEIVQENNIELLSSKAVVVKHKNGTEENNLIDLVKKEEYDNNCHYNHFYRPTECGEKDEETYIIKAEPSIVDNNLNNDDYPSFDENEKNYDNNTDIDEEDVDDGHDDDDDDDDYDRIGCGSAASANDTNEDKQNIDDSEMPKKKLRTKRKITKKNQHDSDDDDSLDKKIKKKRKKIKKITKSSTSTKNIDPDKKKTSKTKDEIDLENQQISYYFKMMCDLCDEKLLNFLDTRNHFTRVHQQTGYLTCCNKKFYRRSRAMDHVRQHLNPDAFKCLECNKSYVDKYALKNHMETHTPIEQREFKCDICTSSYTKLFRLSQHMRQAHLSKKNERKFQCTKCDKLFLTKGILAQHIRGVHEFANAHICHICAKTFKSKQVYELHQREHMDIQTPRLQCKICGAWLKHEHSLRKHMYRHSDGEATCTLCNKVTSNRDALGKHMRYVHMERSYKCTVCEKAFKKSIGLKEHMASHTGEDLYTCPYCPKTFKSSANMHSHRKKIHPIEWQSDRDKRQGAKELLLSKIIM